MLPGSMTRRARNCSKMCCQAPRSTITLTDWRAATSSTATHAVDPVSLAGRVICLISAPAITLPGDRPPKSHRAYSSLIAILRTANEKALHGLTENEILGDKRHLRDSAACRQWPQARKVPDYSPFVYPFYLV